MRGSEAAGQGSIDVVDFVKKGSGVCAAVVAAAGGEAGRQEGR